MMDSPMVGRGQMAIVFLFCRCLLSIYDEKKMCKRNVVLHSLPAGGQLAAPGLETMLLRDRRPAGTALP